jgi:hypothetical protein
MFTIYQKLFFNWPNYKELTEEHMIFRMLHFFQFGRNIQIIILYLEPKMYYTLIVVQISPQAITACYEFTPQCYETPTTL